MDCGSDKEAMVVDEEEETPEHETVTLEDDEIMEVDICSSTETINSLSEGKSEVTGVSSQTPAAGVGEEGKITEEVTQEVTQKEQKVDTTCTPMVTGTPEKMVVRLETPVLFKSPPGGKPSGGGDAGGASGGGGAATSSSSTPGGAQNPAFLKATAALVAALKSEPKKKVFCGNTNCNLKTDTVVVAPSFAKIFFGFAIASQPRICMNCFKKAETYHLKSQLKIKNKENLFDLKVQVQTSSSDTMVDLDSPPTSPSPSHTSTSSEQFGGESGGGDHPMPEQLSVDRQQLETFVARTMQNFGFLQQLNQCERTANEEVDQLAEEMTNLDAQLNQLREAIEGVTKNYNENVATKTQLVTIGSIDICPFGGITTSTSATLPIETQGLSRIAERNLKKAQQELKSLDRPPPSNKPLAATTLQKSSLMPPPLLPLKPLSAPPPPSKNMLPPPNLPPPTNRRMGKLIFVKPKVNQDVYAMHKHSLFYWLPAKILQIHEPPPNPTSTFVSTYYQVQFQVRVSPPRKGDPLDHPSTFIKSLAGKQLAFKKPTTVTLPIGTRIIARFRDLLKTDPDVDGMLYAGIVAELPREMNNNRYLVFFDDGYAQYVPPCDALPVVESSPDVWLDVHKNSQDFIRDYLLAFPNRHMIRAQIGASFTVELNGQWLLARIVEVDASLLKMQYIRRTDGVEFEWIYRGSTRLGPLYSRLKNLQQKPANTVARRHTYSSRRANFSFEQNNPDLEEKTRMRDTTTLPPRLSASQQHQQNQHSPVSGGVIKTKSGQIINTSLESEGSMTKIKIPLDCPSPRKYIAHACGPSCGYKYEEEKFRKVSPLVVPFHLGWAREYSAGVLKARVFYHTPCGIRMGTYQEIHSYVTRTRSEIPIDFFSLENTIDCLNLFEPKRKIEYLKDISYGKEWTPITCVNSLDHDLPAYMEYRTHREPGPGVEINEEEGFLVCCDCTDDCEDKEKCQCWQLTLAGVSFKMAEKEGEVLKGYENRRLKEHVLSGIYECNKQCKCRVKTCFNRVVQNKVKWPIQMFKTVAKGWGVRALHDMPQGSFICVYTGQLLTDQGANESGIEAGDEYLAELDFIECNEGIKEDFESDCTDVEEEMEGTRGREREERRRREEEEMRRKEEEQQQQQQQVQMVARKSTVNKAVKRMGGGVRGGQAVARKSGSKNGLMGAGKEGEVKEMHVAGNGMGLRPRRTKSKEGEGEGDEEEDEVMVIGEGRGVAGGLAEEEEEDDEIQTVYSSFSASAAAAKRKNAPRLPLRELFGKEEAVYIMDAKSMGNFGKYLNHSCDPNVFVQNLFVDTHDPRFPWVAFFTKKDVKAGTELTWDYNYDIGSVPGKTLYCFCLQANCRGRLL